MKNKFDEKQIIPIFRCCKTVSPNESIDWLKQISRWKQLNDSKHCSLHSDASDVIATDRDYVNTENSANGSGTFATSIMCGETMC